MGATFLKFYLEKELGQVLDFVKLFLYILGHGSDLLSETDKRPNAKGDPGDTQAKRSDRLGSAFLAPRCLGHGHSPSFVRIAAPAFRRARRNIAARRATGQTVEFDTGCRPIFPRD